MQSRWEISRLIFLKRNLSSTNKGDIAHATANFIVVIFHVRVKSNRKTTRYKRIGICILQVTFGDSRRQNPGLFFLKKNGFLDPNLKFWIAHITVWRCCANFKSVSSSDMELLCLDTKFNRFFGCYWCGRKAAIPGLSSTKYFTPIWIFSARGSRNRPDVSILTVIHNSWPTVLHGADWERIQWRKS